jgi:hypothetical protein
MVCNARASYYVGQVVLGFLPIVPGLHWSIVRSWLQPASLQSVAPLNRGRQIESFVRLFIRA